MSSRVTKAAKNPFVLGFFASLGAMAASYFGLTHQEYFHNLILNSSYGGLAQGFALFFFLFCAWVFIAGKIYAIIFLVGGLIYIAYLRWTKRPRKN